MGVRQLQAREHQHHQKPEEAGRECPKGTPQSLWRAQGLDFSLLLLLSCFSCVRLCATTEMVAHQAPLSLGFSRQEHWSGLPLPSPMHESKK